MAARTIELICTCDTACCWDGKQPTNNKISIGLLLGHKASTETNESPSVSLFCGRSDVRRLSVHMIPLWCGAGLPPTPKACCGSHPAAVTGVSVVARGNSLEGCGGRLFCCSAESMMPVCFGCARRLPRPAHDLKIVVCPCRAGRLTGFVNSLAVSTKSDLRK